QQHRAGLRRAAGEGARRAVGARECERREGAAGREPDEILGDPGRVPARAAGARSAHRGSAARSRQERRRDRAAAQQEDRLAQLSILAPASLTTLAHFAISLWTSLVNCAGDSPPAVAPWLSQTLFNSGEAIAFSVSACMRSSASFGVPLIPQSAY